MSVSNYKELMEHHGHKLSCVNYGKQNVAVECEDCNVILMDFDNDWEEVEEPSIIETTGGKEWL